MPAVERCLCCGLHQGAVIAGNYAIIVYGAAMGLTLWWIIDKEGNVPIPAYILACLYFITFIASVILVLSLSVQRKTSIVLLWLLVMAMFLLPECGLNMWISIFILGTSTGMGFGFLVFYVARAVINILCMICVHALYCIWKDEKVNRKQKITQMYWRSLYGDATPPFLMWHTPLGPHAGMVPALPPPPAPLMLTYPGFEPPHSGPTKTPVAPPRKRAKMVSAGELISYQVEEPTSILGRPVLADDGPPSRDSAISSEHSSNGHSKPGAPSLIYDPICMPVPPMLRPAVPLALPWNGPTHPQPVIPPPPMARFGHPPPPPSRPLLIRPVPIRQQHFPNGAIPIYGTLQGQRPPGTSVRPPGPKIYEVIRVPKHNPVPAGAVFDIDPHTEAGFENFLLKKTLSEHIHTYRPKSLHGDDDTGYYSQHREPEKHVVKRNPLGHQDYYPPLDPRPPTPPPQILGARTLGSSYRSGLRRTHFISTDNLARPQA